MPDSTPNLSPGLTEPDRADRFEFTESSKYFELERQEEHRKRFASYALLAGILSILLLLVPTPVPWLCGPIAIALAVHALVRTALQPRKHSGRMRAVIGLVLGLVATAASLHHAAGASTEPSSVPTGDICFVRGGLPVHQHDTRDRFPCPAPLQSGGLTGTHRSSPPCSPL